MRTSTLASLVLGAWFTLPLVGCGDDSGTGGQGAGSSGGGGDGPGSGVCILHNCTDSEQCDCSEGRTTCRIEAGEPSGRCVACGSDGTGCPAGEECSPFGACVPEGLTCPTDNMGVPQISCQSSADCEACDPQHMVCDPATSACVACTQNDTAECQSTDICKDGKCAPACATDCQVDNDCQECGGAPACNNHKCSECSATYACKSGEHCELTTGTCEKNCGEVTAPGVCDNTADCAGCIANQNTCHLPINGGPGTCGPNAAGCSDLGSAGALTLPAPYNQITDTCSTDANCAGVGITYNVGQAVRDLFEADDIFGQPIGDANVFYPMASCAAITIADNSCGVCVPCREDSDCGDISIDDLTDDLFPGVGSALLALALDALFGNQEHKLYMYCQQVAAGYGVCVPCTEGLLTDCAPDGGGGGGGSCDHLPSQAGTALDPACDDCAATVCAFDTYCCDTEWDDVCVQESVDNCGSSDCHDECELGAAMGAECTTCTGDVCALDSFCCTTSWDDQCVSEAESECGLTCG